VSDPNAVDPRVQALHAYMLLDTPRTPEFDDLAMLAKVICGTRYAAVNLVDVDRQWFKAEVGFGVRELPLDDSICAKVMLEDALVEIPDLTFDKRFSCNPLITAGPQLRFYAGAPLVSPDGHVLGTLCVLDNAPKKLDEGQMQALAALGRQVMSQMELWRQGAVLRERAVELQDALSRRDHAEAVKRELEAEHRFIIDHALAGLLVHDSNGAVTFCNRMACELLGLSPDQMMGRAPADPSWHFLDEAGDVLALEDYPVSVVARTRRALADYVVGVVLSSRAEPLWALVTAYPQVDDDGALVRTVVSFVDITGRKRAEQRLRDADQRKDDFLAMLAHELRNPLAPVSTAAQLLQRAPGDEARVRSASAIIGRQVDHMKRLVDDLLDVSRVTRGLVQLVLEPLDMKQVVAAAAEQVRPLIEARSHVLATYASPGVMPVTGDRIRLVQVVANLLTNAAKYTPPGGHIDLRVGVEGDEVVVAVHDDGNGIDPDLLPSIFDLFTQAERTPDRTQGGLGIGLALVKSVVERHGGKVEATSEGEGHGSRFTVRLPRVSALPEPAPREAALARGVPGKKILIVDDNEDAALTLAQLLALEGHDVYRAGSGREGIEQAGQQPDTDVFILDIGLPDMTGHELVACLRQRHPTAFFIALSGYGQPQDQALSAATGFDVHLVKPVGASDLFDVLRSATPRQAPV
jgi:PAS domain S-box-containing protein